MAVREAVAEEAVRLPSPPAAAEVVEAAPAVGAVAVVLLSPPATAVVGEAVEPAPVAVVVVVVVGRRPRRRCRTWSRRR